MRAGTQSRTAEYMALFRAIESLRPPARRLFSDPLAAAFLSTSLRAVAWASRLPGLRSSVLGEIDRRGAGARISGVLRTLLIDEALRDALAAGIRQVVILGAGYDSRMYRIPGADTARGFELDHFDTQSVKCHKLERLLGSLPRHVTFVPIDFVYEQFGERLLQAGYQTTLPTFFIWEGVTNYLTEEAVEGVLRWMGSRAAPGSRLSFTYVNRGLIDGSVEFPGAGPWLEAVRRAGEPFTFGLDPGAVSEYLLDRGLRLIDDMSTAAAWERLRSRVDGGSRPPAFYHVALAEISPETVAA